MWTAFSRFQKDVYPKHRDLFERLALGQRPDALFITCADSRIDPCLLTQTKPGELFICRVIGNIVPPYPGAIGGVSATIEYAAAVLRVPEIIVCGHTDCGVIKVALHPEAVRKYPSISAWLRYVEAGWAGPASDSGVSAGAGRAQCGGAIGESADASGGSGTAEGGDLKLHGWVYHIGSGVVTAYDEASGKFSALEAM